MSDPTPRATTHLASAPWFAALVSTAIFIAGLVIGRTFLIPLAIAGLIFGFSLALDDTCQRIRVGSWSPSRLLSRLMTLGMVVAGLGGVAYLLSVSFDELSRLLPDYAAMLTIKLDQVSKWVPASVVDSVLGGVMAMDLQPLAATLLRQITGSFAAISMVGFYVVFLFLERDAWAQKLPLIAKTPHEVARTRMMLGQIGTSVKKYIWINTVTSALSAAVAYGIFWSVGLDFAVMLALIVFVAGFIPTIGSIIGIALPALVALLQFDSYVPFLVVLLGFGLADQVVANVLQPALQGKSLNISTFVVVAALAFWGMIWGGIGMFLAIPLTVMIMIICAEFPATHWFAVLLSQDGDVGGAA